METLPEYTPGQWVIYNSGRLHTFGQIIGGHTLERGGKELWFYSIQTGHSDKASSVSQEDILAVFDGGIWQGVR